MTKLAVGIPTYNGIDNVGSLLELQRKIPFQYMECRGHPILPQARNMLFNTFLASDATHLLSLDGDVHFKAEAVLDCLASGKDLVGIPYPKRNTHGFTVQLFPETRYTNPLPVKSLGLGFLLISRKALITYASQHPERYYLEGRQKKTVFCDVGVYEEIFACESYTFCRYMRESGQTLYALPDWNLAHAGKKACFLCEVKVPHEANDACR